MSAVQFAANQTRYKYLSGYFHFLMGRESKARKKWKLGAAESQKHGLLLMQALCNHELARTRSSGTSVNLSAGHRPSGPQSDPTGLIAVSNAFASCSAPHLQHVSREEVKFLKSSVAEDLDKRDAWQRFLSRHRFNRLTHRQNIRKNASGAHNRRRSQVLRSSGNS